MFHSFVLGAGSAILAFFGQLFITLFVNDAETLASLLLFTAIEEGVRFGVLFLATQKKVIPQHILPVAVVFGSGFALTEATIAQDFSVARLTSLFAVHITLSLCLLFGVRKQKPIFATMAFFLTLVLHTLYNTVVWFASF